MPEESEKVPEGSGKMKGFVTSMLCIECIINRMNALFALYDLYVSFS